MNEGQAALAVEEAGQKPESQGVEEQDQEDQAGPDQEGQEGVPAVSLGFTPVSRAVSARFMKR